MRKISYILLFLMCALGKSNAQENLVLNPSFEKMNWCWCPSRDFGLGCGFLSQSLCSKYPYYLDVRDYHPNLSEFSNYTWSLACDSTLLNLTLWSRLPVAFGSFNFTNENIFYSSGNGNSFDFTRPPFNTEKRKYQNVYAVVNLLNLALPISAEEQSIAGRTFLQGKLSKPLKKGCQYEFKVSVYPGVNYYFNKGIIYTTSSLGVAFTNDSVFYPNYKELIANHHADIENPVDRILNDTSDFMSVEGVYTARGGERYLLLGNFKTNEQTVVYPKKIPITITSYPNDYYPIRLDYVIDELSLTAIPPFHLKLNLGKDTITCGKDQPLQLVAQQGFDSYTWNTDDTSRVLNITKAGTYVVKADFGCGVISDTIVVKAYNYKKNQLQIGELLQKCPEEQISLKAANGYTNYTWSNGQNGAELSTSTEGVYTLQATSKEGCTVKDTVQILNITAPQKVYLGNDTVICQGKSIVLDAGTQNAVSFTWNTGANSQTIEAKETGNYSVAVANKCFQVSDTINIDIKDCSSIFIPNVFTPNGDGNNDNFKIRTEDNRTVTLDIYNRWGERLYHQASYHNQWNAEGIPDGIYFYQIVDSEYNKTEKGWVQVLR